MTVKVAKNEIDMTSGNLFRKIFVFTLPIIFSGVLQLFYNAADLVVCGRFGSEHSVGAISATNSLIHLIINLFIGLSVGTNVLMARCFGSNQKEKGQRVVYTAMILSVVFGVVVGIVGAVCSKYFLRWMGTPDEVIDLSSKYLLIYFCGTPFSLIYNFGSSLLRATGDTKRPFYFLAGAGVVNILFNLLFVVGFKLDVVGVALGTILSQAASAVCIVVCLLKNKGFFHFRWKEIKFYKDEALEILRIGLPAGIQSVIFSLSNVLIQSSVNSLGASAMDGNGAASSIEGFVYTSMNSFAQACIAFVSANYGAKNRRNIKRTVLYSCCYILIFGISVGALAALFGRSLLKVYLDNPEAIEIGYSRLIVICLTYFLCGLMEIFAFSIRGIGYSLVPTIVSLVGVCGFRILWIYTVFPTRQFRTLQGLALSYPISWLITALLQFALFVILFVHIKKKLSKEEQLAAEEEQLAADIAEEN